ncbi:hypothetical protein BDN70DRAFT_223837 [Pholiota conissans]|uniref:Uncharacterized protein n=1 Tax=Pholiota conissans TaxID=109636 RepID=A0A9P6CWZ6_9AGAR|nr:hypothetical protein BDN70DRAFT_223837 [Pholiota conissans]
MLKRASGKWKNRRREPAIMTGGTAAIFHPARLACDARPRPTPQAHISLRPAMFHTLQVLAAHPELNDIPPFSFPVLSA